MKKCLACDSVFNDDNMSFCSNCGANLVDEVVAEPVVEPITEEAQQPTPPPQYNYNYNTNTPPCKYCMHCGNPCDPKAAICVKCGAPFGKSQFHIPSEDDKPSGILKVLCFFIPVLGLILFLVNMNEKPVSAKAYGKSALIGFVVGIALYVIFFIAMFMLPFIFGFSTSGVDVYLEPETEFIFKIFNMF